MNELPHINLDAITIDAIVTDDTSRRNINLRLLRLDKIHPVISGNKWFKLKFFIEDARQKGFTRLLTFGGPYSNHIVASAYAAKLACLQITGIIRGEEPRIWSDTLKDAQSYGMQLQFVPRSVYDVNKRVENLNWLTGQFGPCYIVPEGGMGVLGVKGVTACLNELSLSEYTHFAVPVGTGTTVTALLNARLAHQQVMAFSAMKNNNALPGEIENLFGRSLPADFRIIDRYHFGGYGKHDRLLIDWMNGFYKTTGIALDFVYTGKMMFGVLDMVKNGELPAGADILAIHTGGLQGNGSLKGHLIYG